MANLALQNIGSYPVDGIQKQPERLPGSMIDAYRTVG